MHIVLLISYIGKFLLFLFLVYMFIFLYSVIYSLYWIYWFFLCWNMDGVSPGFYRIVGDSTLIVQSYGKEAIRKGYLVIISKECVNKTNERLKK